MGSATDALFVFVVTELTAKLSKFYKNQVQSKVWWQQCPGRQRFGKGVSIVVYLTVV